MTYMNCLKYWVKSTLCAWTSFGDLWYDYKYVWREVGICILKAIFLVFAPILIILAPLFAYLDMRTNK